MSEWISLNCTENYPAEGEFVLVKFDDDFIGISSFSDDGWEISGKFRRPIYRGKDKIFTSCDPQYWMPLPESIK